MRLASLSDGFQQCNISGRVDALPAQKNATGLGDCGGVLVVPRAAFGEPKT